MSFYLKSCLHFVSFGGWHIYVLFLYKNVMHQLTVVFKRKRKHCPCISNCLLIWGMHHTVITWIQDKNKLKVHSLQNLYYNFSSVFFFLLSTLNRDFCTTKKMHLWKCDCVCADVDFCWLFLTLLYFVSEINLQSPKCRPCDLPSGKGLQFFCLAPKSKCPSLLPLGLSHSMERLRVEEGRVKQPGKVSWLVLVIPGHPTSPGKNKWRMTEQNWLLTPSSCCLSGRHPCPWLSDDYIILSLQQLNSLTLLFSFFFFYCFLCFFCFRAVLQKASSRVRACVVSSLTPREYVPSPREGGAQFYLSRCPSFSTWIFW